MQCVFLSILSVTTSNRCSRVRCSEVLKAEILGSPAGYQGSHNRQAESESPVARRLDSRAEQTLQSMFSRTPIADVGIPARVASRCSIRLDERAYEAYNQGRDGVLGSSNCDLRA